MRTTIVKLCEALAVAVDLPEPVCEFGALRVAGQEHRPEVSAMLGDKVFVGCDMRVGPGVHQVHDLHALGFADDSIGTALLFDTIEHVREPWRAFDELHRALKPGGVVVMTSVFYFPIHAYPDDYWRFTDSAFSVLMHKLDVVVVANCGPRRLPHTVVGVGSKGPLPTDLTLPIRSVVDAWLVHGATSWKERAMMALPPLVGSGAYEMFVRARTRLTTRPIKSSREG
jgi:SAM-dependent methyltransferase